MTVEGAPYLKEEHYPIFDCANKCGQKGERFIHAHGHIKMMAAAQPFLQTARPQRAARATVCHTVARRWRKTRQNLSITVQCYLEGARVHSPVAYKSGVLFKYEC